MPEKHAQTRNRLLDAFPARALARIKSHLELVRLSPSDVLFDTGEQLKYVYFPTTGIVSLVNVMANNQITELVSVGNEGMLGTSTFMGDGITTARAVVHGEAHGHRLEQDQLLKEFHRERPVFRLLLGYIQVLISPNGQAAAYNRHHLIEQRLCRVLLESLDRFPTNKFVTTHDQIATKLGVRREGITEAVGRLRNAGLVQIHRGAITILDRLGLEKAGCECNDEVKLAFGRLFADASRFTRSARDATLKSNRASTMS